MRVVKIRAVNIHLSFPDQPTDMRSNKEISLHWGTYQQHRHYRQVSVINREVQNGGFRFLQ